MGRKRTKKLNWGDLKKNRPRRPVDQAVRLFYFRRVWLTLADDGFRVQFSMGRTTTAR